MNTVTAVLLAVLACALAAAAAPQERQFSQQFLDQEYNRYRQQVPFYTDGPEEEPELNFFQRLIRPWNWMSYIREYFSSSDEDDEGDYAEVYDTFPGGAAYPGAQVARLDERPPAYHQQYRPQQYPPQQQQQQPYRQRPVHNQYQAGGRLEAPYPQAPPQEQLGRSHPEEQEHADAAVNLQQEQAYAGEQESQPLA